MSRLDLAIPLLLAIACGRPPPPVCPPAASPTLPQDADAGLAIHPPITGELSLAMDPDVSATVPLNEAVGVSTGQRISVTFNEAMDPATLTAASFSVLQGETSVPGQLSYDPESHTATFTPAVALRASRTYDVRIDTGAKSASGRTLVAPLSWSFTTR